MQMLHSNPVCPSLLGLVEEWKRPLTANCSTVFLMFFMRRPRNDEAELNMCCGLGTLKAEASSKVLLCDEEADDSCTAEFSSRGQILGLRHTDSGASDSISTLLKRSVVISTSSMHQDQVVPMETALVDLANKKCSPTPAKSSIGLRPDRHLSLVAASAPQESPSDNCDCITACRQYCHEVGPCKTCRSSEH